MCLPMLGVWHLGIFLPRPSSSLVNFQAQMLKESAGLLKGSRNSVIRASTAKVGGLGFDPQWLPIHFSLQYVSILIYHQLLPPVVVNQYSYEK